MMLVHWLVLIPLWTAALAACAYIWQTVAAWKRPPRCANCGRRPRWAFDTSARNGQDLARDHAKVCEA